MMPLRDLSNSTPSMDPSHITSDQSINKVKIKYYQQTPNTYIPTLAELQKNWGIEIYELLTQKILDANEKDGEFKFQTLDPKYDIKPFSKDKFGFFYYGQYLPGTNTIEGQGIQIQPNESIKQGTFKNGFLETGRIINKYGSIRRGTFVGKELEGEGYQKTKAFTY